MAEKMPAFIPPVARNPSQMRYALVRSSDTARVAAYLPGRYEVVGVVNMETMPFSGANVLIMGEDYGGWTMDGYVIPRLQSGLLFCREISETMAQALANSVSQ